jgi:hypothetical protein
MLPDFIKLQLGKEDLKVCGGGMLLQLLTFWTSIVLFFI